MLGEDGKVAGVAMERTALQGDGTVKGTGEFLDYPVQAVYRAVGYYGTEIDGVPFDDVQAASSPTTRAASSTPTATPVPGFYTTGWIKRGPVGPHRPHEVRRVGDHREPGRGCRGALSRARRPSPEQLSPDNILRLLKERGVPVIQWRDWEVLDAHERALGEADGRERVKVVPRDEMTNIALGRDVAPAPVRRGPCSLRGEHRPILETQARHVVLQQEDSG